MQFLRDILLMAAALVAGCFLAIVTCQLMAVLR